MNLAALADHVCTKIGKTDAASIAACKGYLRARHEMIYDAGLWKDVVAEFEADAEAEATEVILPWECARPLAVWKDGTNLPIDVTSLIGVAITAPAALSNVGGTLKFVEMESVGWAYPVPSGGTRISFISSNDAPVEINIRGIVTTSISGTSCTSSVSETVTATDGAAALSTYTYTSISRMSKAATEESIAVASTADIPELIWLWPPDLEEVAFARLRLINPQSDAITLKLIGKRRFRQMNLDGDSPMIRGIDNALLAFAMGDMLERGRQYAKAQAKTAEGTALIALAKDVERGQSASEERIIPEPYVQEGQGYW